MEKQTTAVDASAGAAAPEGAPSASPAGQAGDLYTKVAQLMATPYEGNLHIGFWTAPRDADTLAAATDRMTDLIADHLHLSSGRQLLDVGAGTGKPALRMASRYGVEVTGISLSTDDMARAGGLASAEGLADRVRFEHADAQALPYAAESFDTACAVESMTHVPDRPRAFRELHRVLRPGGRVVVADGVLHTPLRAEHLDEVRALCAGLTMHLPPTLDIWHRELREAGLIPADSIDLGDHWRYSAQRMLHSLHEARAAYERVLGAQVFAGMLAAMEEYCGRPELGYALLVAERE